MIELLVVVAMIAILLAALTTSVSAAQERARVQKATSEVKVLSQAILASENYARAGGQYILEPMGGTDPKDGQDANASTLKDVLGQGRAAQSGGQVPALIEAVLRSNGTMYDPWGTPYKIQIKQGDATVKIESASGSLTSGYCLPNFYRLSAKERQ